jgi:peptidoglycan hydrolase-like protein with peptidoglycan-binding domain
MFIGFGVAIVAIVGLIIGFALLSSNTRATNRPPQVAVNTSAPPLPSATDTNPYASATPTSPATTPEVSPTTAPPATTAQDILPGAQGDDVKTVQRELRALGLYRGKISGKDSAATVLAISRFQQQEHITSDPPGVVGPTTAAALANAAGGQ